MSFKNFDAWNKRKKGIHSRKDAPDFYHEREIWWCAMGTNIGVEADGKGEDYGRPVLVLKGFNKSSFLGVAITGKRREGVYFIYIGKIKDRDASVNLSQIRLFDTKRLVNKLGMLNEKSFQRIRKTLRSWF